MRRIADLRVTSARGVNGLLLRWLPVVIWMGVIFAFSAQPTLPSLPGAFWDTLMKKGGHLTVYAVLAALSWRALEPRRSVFGWAWLLAVLYACTDEWHQSFVPGRHPMATDVLIDACGAAVALLLIWIMQRKTRNM